MTVTDEEKAASGNLPSPYIFTENRRKYYHLHSNDFVPDGKVGFPYLKEKNIVLNYSSWSAEGGVVKKRNPMDRISIVDEGGTCPAVITPAQEPLPANDSPSHGDSSDSSSEESLTASGRASWEENSNSGDQSGSREDSSTSSTEPNDWSISNSSDLANFVEVLDDISNEDLVKSVNDGQLHGFTELELDIPEVVAAEEVSSTPTPRASDGAASNKETSAQELGAEEGDNALDRLFSKKPAAFEERFFSPDGEFYDSSSDSDFFVEPEDSNDCNDIILSENPGPSDQSDGYPDASIVPDESTSSPSNASLPASGSDSPKPLEVLDPKLISESIASSSRAELESTIPEDASNKPGIGPTDLKKEIKPETGLPEGNNPTASSANQPSSRDDHEGSSSDGGSTSSSEDSSSENPAPR
eukprot:TRINITY_DN1354_c0_g1_i3.p1 TRINITY_DN1354_c0_g1~~TRINITY_DN1354_c0_g1_i3.p1  ORF type:complete len:473 (-),score=55.50 TRINITY_DN1354_c0_g1_i3:359-1600(-)